MGSSTKAAIAVSIVVSVICPQSTGAVSDDGFSPQQSAPCEIVLQTEFRHPASRKYVTGPWPRFAKEMLA
jgi:hypothetical protein